MRPVSLSVLEARAPLPCLGSGQCCKQARCSLGTRLHGPGRDCPSLVFDARTNRHYCGEILSSSGAERARIAAQLYIGAGCCSSINDARAELARQNLSWRVGDPCSLWRLHLYDGTIAAVDARGRPTHVLLEDGERIDLDDARGRLFLFQERRPIVAGGPAC